MTTTSNDNQAAVAFTITDLMKRWRCERKVIYAAIREGRLRAFLLGKRAFRVRVDEVERFEREHRGAA